MAAANKVSNKGIQHDLSEAQQCKFENMCIHCFKLQSELNEVRLELKSVKEIVNILNRDLALIDVRIHNLHEQESSHIATQPFENWPLRHSTKKIYSEVTAYKPYTVTKNRFQLLDNLQENDSSVDWVNSHNLERITIVLLESEVPVCKVNVKWWKISAIE